MMDRHRDHMDNGWGAGWIAMLFMMLVVLVLVGAVVWFVVGGARRPSSGDGVQNVRPTPEQVVAVRLARGEIAPDEYRQRLAALGKRGPRPPA
jgi:putative membrane protein